MKVDYTYKEDTYIIKDGPSINMPEVRLYQAMLGQAMEDIQKGTPRERDDALRWLMDNDNIVLEMCLFVSKISKRDIMQKVDEYIMEKINAVKPFGEQLFWNI